MKPVTGDGNKPAALKPGALSKCAQLAQREEKKVKGSPATGEKPVKHLSKCEKLFLAEQKKEEAKVRHAPAQGYRISYITVRSPVRSPVTVPQVKALEREAKKVADEAKKAAPKKPQSGYFLFCGASRAQLKEDEPDLSMIEMTKKLGARRVLLNMGPCTPSLSVPARAVSHFLRSACATWRCRASLLPRCVAAAQWKELTEEEKREYEAKAEEDKDRYLKECEEAGVEPELPKEKKAKAPKQPVAAWVAHTLDLTNGLLSSPHWQLARWASPQVMF